MTDYSAFFVKYKGVTNELTTPASILPLFTTNPAFFGVPFEIEALWNTGATTTCIKPALWKRLELYPLESGCTELSGIGGNVATDLTLINLLLAPKFEIEGCPVYVVDFPGNADILIGMDIISMGDFAVCNTGKTSSFSFVIPPFSDRINFVDKAGSITPNTTS